MGPQQETRQASPDLVVPGALAVPENRGANGRFLPGNNANPGGRPRGFAAMIREQTGDGAELVAFALKTLRSKREDARLRFQALEWLADRGFGKAIQSHEVTGADGSEIVFRLTLGERSGDE